jgi:basic membrane protein A
MRKKYLFVLAILLILGGFFVFMSQMNDNSEKTWKPGEPLDKKLVTIGVIQVSDPEKEISGYAYEHMISIREMQRELGLGDDQIFTRINVSDTDQEATEHALRECVARGANIIVATSWGYMDVCERLASEYPGVIFVNASGYKHNDTNFTNYFGRIYQARYLSGIVAGLRTRTNKIGFVAAMGKDNSEVTGGLNAFAIGVESVNPDAHIYVRVTHRWFDPEGESQATRSLIADGCDVIGQHTDTAGPMIEAQRAGIWGVGYNSDMRNYAPDATIVSVVWNWGTYYIRLVRSVIDGTFTTTPYFGDIKDGMVGITPLNERILPPGVANAVAYARARIESGDFGVFDGILETNDGRTVGTEGRTLSDTEITLGIDWYYRNIIEP